MTKIQRCPWAVSELAIRYHDLEWGAFSMDDAAHFEHLCLEGFQAGLSWETILKKRENLRRLFSDFDPEIIATYDEKRIAQILTDAGGIRNAAKIRSVVNNAGRFLNLRREFGTFSGFLLDLIGGKPIINAFTSLAEIPARTDVSTAVSEELKRRGFTFVGPTIVYAHLQAMGFVNDHLVGCFRREETIREVIDRYGP
jgi:DNA-3-methyladenine glycosylase I